MNSDQAQAYSNINTYVVHLDNFVCERMLSAAYTDQNQLGTDGPWPCMPPRIRTEGPAKVVNCDYWTSE